MNKKYSWARQSQRSKVITITWPEMVIFSFYLKDLKLFLMSKNGSFDSKLWMVMPLSEKAQLRAKTFILFLFYFIYSPCLFT